MIDINKSCPVCGKQGFEGETGKGFPITFLPVHYIILRHLINARVYTVSAIGEIGLDGLRKLRNIGPKHASTIWKAYRRF